MTRASILSLLWVFLSLNFLWCDVFTLMHAPDLKEILTGEVGGVALSQTFLLAFAVVMELALAMILVSRLAPHAPARVANILVALLLTVIQGGSLLVGGVSLHYVFFSVVEIATALSIIWLAVTWRAASP
ncbi:MAG: hypothetical protein GC146_05315 [Limimaricola sp.]|uniref:DUF6326 family protein n=1 Tax=Limimaricola sp. TaxID=2211665 RepID=UPI001E01FABA|nr:DUF6326 family protein [Limimaricola sp.]MBI1416626.1 hypothetical protein [Limimaricola sp.]